jgi:hypothetical protein
MPRAMLPVPMIVMSIVRSSRSTSPLCATLPFRSATTASGGCGVTPAAGTRA